MPDIAGVRIGASDNPTDNVTNLKGMPSNPGRDPKTRANAEKGTIGDKALMDSLVIVAGAWILLVFLAYSLRHHNV